MPVDMSVDLLWRIVVLTLVFGTDLVVFIGLCRYELRDSRADHRTRDSSRYPSDETVSAIRSNPAILKRGSSTNPAH